MIYRQGLIMPDSKFKISLRENGEHSFKKGLESYNEYEKTKNQMLLKDTILFLHNGIELLMKEMLVRNNEFLIFEDLKDIPKKQKQARTKGIGIFFIDTPPKSVSYEEAYKRVDAFINPPELDASLLEWLHKLNLLRNQLEHYAIDGDKDEIVEILEAIHKPILNLFENHLGPLTQLQTPQVKQAWKSINNSHEEYKQRLQEVHQLMDKFNGQKVPGFLFGVDHDVVLPKFDNIYESYRLNLDQNGVSRGLEFDIMAETLKPPTKKSSAKWIVEIKLRTPPDRTADMTQIKAFIINATPWLIVFDKVIPTSQDKAKKSQLMITDLNNFEILKQLIMSTT